MTKINGYILINLEDITLDYFINYNIINHWMHLQNNF